jgi:predicted DNA-binding protein (MmcQ/YjbR family)
MSSEKRANATSDANDAIRAAAEAMRRHALSYPETHEDFPWEDHRVIKVKGKVFVFMGMAPEELSFSVKLPQSKDIALMLPFATPTGYGLGRSGWVSASFTDASPPVDMLLAWVDESYRAIAPKRLIARLDAPLQGTGAAAGAAAGAAGKAKAPARKKAAPASKAEPARKKAAQAVKAEPAKRTAKKRGT